MKKDKCFYSISLPEAFIQILVEAVKTYPVTELYFGLDVKTPNEHIPHQKVSFVGCFTKKKIQVYLEVSKKNPKTQHENICHPLKVPDHTILQRLIENPN